MNTSRNRFSLIYLMLIIGVIALFMINFPSSSSDETLTINQVAADIKDGKITRVIQDDSNHLIVIYKDANQTEREAQKEAETPTSAGESSGPDEGEEFDVIILNGEDYKKNRKGPVEFTHKKHALDYKILCWECHHVYEDDNRENPNLYSPWGETDTCDSCHDPKEEEITDIRLQRAYHLNCKGCHKQLAHEKKKAGEYRKCTGCHQKLALKK